tara:strand:+ start:183 stop:599 length:417 start_codon:yes stop_codon:yes gene_type:complete
LNAAEEVLLGQRICAGQEDNTGGRSALAFARFEEPAGELLSFPWYRNGFIAVACVVQAQWETRDRLIVKCRLARVGRWQHELRATEVGKGAQVRLASGALVVAPGRSFSDRVQSLSLRGERLNPVFAIAAAYPRYYPQ